jgi:hypothetical protein
MRLLILRTLADFSGRTQPQREVGGLHRFPHHAYQIVAHGQFVSVQALVNQLSRNRALTRRRCDPLDRPASNVPIREQA